MRKKKITFGSKKRRGLDVKKCALIVVVMSIVIAVGFKGVTATTAFLEEKKQERIERQKKAEAERLAEEKRKKEEEEAKKRMVGVNHEAKKYSYDAVKVSEKLSKYDYSNNGEKIVFTATCGKDVVARGIKAGDMVREAAKTAGGNGGGKPDFAMAGAKELDKVIDELRSLTDIFHIQ